MDSSWSYGSSSSISTPFEFLPRLLTEHPGIQSLPGCFALRRRPLILFYLSTRRLALVGAVLFTGLCLGVLGVGGSERQRSEAIEPLSDLLVVLDPGHGGEDRGVCYFPSDLIEKEINLDMAFRLRHELERVGARVLITRREDTFVSLDERADLANAAGADLFLSLHVNRIPGHPECYGAQTFYFPGSAEGERLAKLLQEELIKIDPENYRSPLPGSYRVLRLTTMPGALVEIGFMTNARDRGLIATDEYRDRVASAIVQGVIRFVQESPH